MACTARLNPLRQPKNHRPPVPRWQLRLPPDVNRVHTAYLGVQCHSEHSQAVQASYTAIQALKAWIYSAAGDSPAWVEAFRVVDGDDIKRSRVWVCYWNDTAKYEQSLKRLSLRHIHAGLDEPGRQSVGVWCERFSTAVSRLETNYSGLDYLPGISRFPDTELVEHTLSAYWGAARDRIPDSAFDRFEKSDSSVSSHPSPTPRGLDQRVAGSNYDNLVHIRSGQFWENCSPAEAEAYETTLEPTLLQGLGYVWTHPEETGNAGLRFLRNNDDRDVDEHEQRERKETCGAGFFRSLDELENWAERHKSHLAIYLGAIKHAKEFGADRKLRTWHEVSVLKRGEAAFEYINCVPQTGAIQYLGLDEVEELPR